MRKIESILAFDLGSSNVKLVEVVTQGQELFVKVFAVIPVPDNLREIESINDPRYVDFLKTVISTNNISAKDVVLCISHPQLEIKNITIPKMTRKELNLSMNWQVKDILSISKEEAVVDYKILDGMCSPDNKDMEVCVSAVPKKVSDDYVLLLRSLDLRPLAFVLEPEAGYNAVRNISEIKDKKTVALLNMGAYKTTISVFENGSIKVTRNLPVSGNRFTVSISSKVRTVSGEGLDFEKSELIKHKYGISEKTEVNDENINPQDVFSALRPSLEVLVVELSRFLEHYKTEFNGSSIEIIAIYGGASKLAGLSDYISRNTGVPVILPDCGHLNLAVIHEKETTKFRELGLFLVSSIGALLVLDKSIDLLPQEVKEQKQLQTAKGMWIKIWIGLSVAVLVIYAALSLISSQRQRTLNSFKNKYEKFIIWKEELNKYGLRVNELKIKMKLCSELLRDEPFWEDLLKEIADMVPGDIIVTEVALSGAGDGSGRTAKHPFSIYGKVYKGDLSVEDVLTKFLQDLEKSRYFRGIKLEYSREGKSEDGKTLEFKISCDLK